MNNKDLRSLMEAYDSLATPTGDAAMSNDLANTADVDTQTSGEGDSLNEKILAVDNNTDLFKSILRDIAKLISKGTKLEPWMEEKIIKAINYINSATNDITNIRDGIKNKSIDSQH